MDHNLLLYIVDMLPGGRRKQESSQRSFESKNTITTQIKSAADKPPSVHNTPPTTHIG